MDPNDRPNEATQTLLVEGRFSEAIPHLEALVMADSCEAQDAVNLACSYQQVGDYAAAIELFDQIIEREDLIFGSRLFNDSVKIPIASAEFTD